MNTCDSKHPRELADHGAADAPSCSIDTLVAEYPCVRWALNILLLRPLNRRGASVEFSMTSSPLVPAINRATERAHNLMVCLKRSLSADALHQRFPHHAAAQSGPTRQQQETKRCGPPALVLELRRLRRHDEPLAGNASALKGDGVSEARVSPVASLAGLFAPLPKYNRTERTTG